MPVYQVGDLVRPHPRYSLQEENPEALGLILEMRSMLHMRPEARILWNDMLETGPRWMYLQDVAKVETDETR